AVHARERPALGEPGRLGADVLQLNVRLALLEELVLLHLNLRRAAVLYAVATLTGDAGLQRGCLRGRLVEAVGGQLGDEVGDAALKVLHAADLVRPPAGRRVIDDALVLLAPHLRAVGDAAEPPVVAGREELVDAPPLRGVAPGVQAAHAARAHLELRVR